jgi:hypothetical protein
VFRLLYYAIGQPPTWLAYVQFLVVFVLMGLTYLHVTRRRIGFMPMFGVMTAIFLVDFLAYLPFLGYIIYRDRKRGRPPRRSEAAAPVVD